jgi:hypothetical protein
MRNDQKPYFDGYVIIYPDGRLEGLVFILRDVEFVLAFGHLYFRHSILVGVAPVWVQNNLGILNRSLRIFVDCLYCYRMLNAF